MKKALLSIFILLVILISACQQAAIEPVMDKKEGAMQKEVSKVEAAPGTGEAAVDAVGSGLTNVDSVEKDLSSDDLSDVDAGLADVQNI